MKKGFLFSLFAAVALLGAALAIGPPSNNRYNDNNGYPSVRDDDQQLARGCRGGRGGRFFQRRGGGCSSCG